MEASDMFVKFVYDDSVLNSRLEDSDEKLKEHDELIKELQERINNLPTNSQLEFLQQSITKDFEKQISEMNNKYEDLLNQYNSLKENFQNLSEDTETKINELKEYTDFKVQKNFDNIIAAQSPEKNRIDSIEQRITDCENDVNYQKKEITDNRANIQIIASSIAELNNSDALLDKDLQDTLKTSVDFVKINLHKIFDELEKLKSSMLQQAAEKSANENLKFMFQQQPSRSQSLIQKPAILSPHVQKPGINFNSPQNSQKQQLQPQPQPQSPIQSRGQIDDSNESDSETQAKTETPIKTEPEIKKDSPIQPADEKVEYKPQLQPLQPPPKEVINNSGSSSKLPNVTFNTNVNVNQPNSTNNQKKPSTNAPNQPPPASSIPRDFIPYDLSKVRPYSDVQVHWQDNPKLPEIRPFLTIEEVVNHLYKLQPYIQAYLMAMHGKLYDCWIDLQQKVDKNLVEKMFERMQNIVAEINSSLNKLKDEISQTATRKEINSFMDELTKSMRNEGQTAVGRVRCIACGREMTQITGAMTEAEINRAFGPSTPNSLVRGINNHKPGVSYSSREGFDSAIIEEPRSKRPAQNVLQQPQNLSQQIQVKTKAKI